MAETERTTDMVARQLRLTRLGLWAERITRAFWPAWSAAFAGVAVWAIDVVPNLWEFSLLGGLGLLALVLFFLGLRGFRAPSAEDARARLDATLPGRPLATLDDGIAIGGDDPQSAAVWQVHRKRMAARLAGARAVAPDLRIASRDPYALRYMAVLAMAVALLFGTLWRAPPLPNVAGAGPAVASGPAWEGWLQPPRYTGLPTLYLAEIAPGEVQVPQGTQVILRLYGQSGALSVSETVSGRDTTVPIEPLQEFTVTQSGTLAIDGAPEIDGRPALWTLSATPDAIPQIALDGDVTFEQPDLVTLPWTGNDDHGIVAARVTIALDENAPERRHGLVATPEPREALELDMALPIAGDRGEVVATFRASLAEHPLAGMPVTVTLEADDAAGQTGSFEAALDLPGRPFYDPIAAALVEQRRDLFWSRDNRARVTRILRAATWRADDAWQNPTAYLIVRMAIRQLASDDAFTPEVRDEVADMLWQAAIRLEENSLDSALERLRQAQDRLSEAIRQGAPPEEIARLMDDMRRAMDDYTRQLAQQQGDQGQQQQQAQGDTQEVTPDMLDQMMQRIEELMEQGRTAEAQELLRQLQEMMENMQVTQGQGGQGQPGEGEQAMDELRETLREQQDLSDEAFRELQEQFGQNQQQGQPQQGQQGQGQQSQGQPQPGQGQPGQSQPGGQGQSQQAERPDGSQGGNPQPGDQQGGGALDGQTLAERQEALRRGLDQLRGALPGADTEAGEAAREALGRAEEAMRDAERDLAEGNLGGALDDQARAMDALRDGMQELGRALAQNQQEGQQGGENGQAQSQDNRARDRDPLGRQSGQGGQLGTDESLLGGPDAARRARNLRDEIRRRSGERDRPQIELDYLRRLLDRF